MPKSDYVIQFDPKTLCPNCHCKVHLLSPKNYMPWNWQPTFKAKPWFYICFTCAVVSQVGRGEVPRLGPSLRELADRAIDDITS